MGPTVGRSVHYYSKTKVDELLDRKTERFDGPLTATITALNQNGTVALTVFFPPLRGGPALLVAIDDVPFSETPEGGRWTWPPRV